MAVGATVVVVGAALLLGAADPDYAIVNCALAVIVATGAVMAIDLPS